MWFTDIERLSSVNATAWKSCVPEKLALGEPKTMSPLGAGVWLTTDHCLSVIAFMNGTIFGGNLDVRVSDA